MWIIYLHKRIGSGGFLGGPVVKTSHLQGAWIQSPVRENYDPSCHVVQPKNVEKKEIRSKSSHLLLGWSDFHNTSREARCRNCVLYDLVFIKQIPIKSLYVVKHIDTWCMHFILLYHIIQHIISCMTLWG